jgi:hypothetical protein
MKLLKALILATGIAMLAVPLAQSRPSCADPGLLGEAGYKSVCLPAVFYNESWANDSKLKAVNVRLVPLVTEHQHGQYDPQPIDQSVPLVTEHQYGQYDPQPVPTVVNVTSDTGFSWEDAGIGAAGGIFLMLLAGGAVIAINRNRTRLASF